MNAPVILRTTVLLGVLLLAACEEEPPPEPLVDVTPLGDALRFLAVAIVLGAIITSIFNAWNKE